MEQKKGVWVPSNDSIHVRLYVDAEVRGPRLTAVLVYYELNGKVLSAATGVSLLPEEWDAERECPEVHYRGYKKAMTVIGETVDRVAEAIEGSRGVPLTESYTYEAVLNRSRCDAQGLCPVWIKRQGADKAVYMDSGLVLRAADWDSVRSLPRLDVPNGAFYAYEITRRIERLQEMDRLSDGSQVVWDAPDLCVLPYDAHQLSDGRVPIYVLLKEDNGRASFHATGVYLRREEWNDRLALPEFSSPYHDMWRKRIEAVYVRCKEGRSLSELRNAQVELELPRTEKGVPMWVGPYIQWLLDRFADKELYGNRSVYVTIQHDLEETIGALNCRFSSFGINWLRKLETRYRRLGLKETTISNRFRTLKAIWNKAIRDHVAAEVDYPFEGFQLSRFDLQTAHRALTKEDVLKVLNYELQPEDDPYMELAIDLFSFAYLCGGVPYYDLCMLTPANIQDGVLKYNRKKTHLPIRVAVPDRAMAIVRKYADRSKGYLFPIMDEGIHVTELQQRNRVNGSLKRLNPLLKQLGRKLDLPLDLTSYVARHSFATVLKQENVSIGTISELMGHQDPETTRIYLGSFKGSQLAEVQSLLLDGVNTEEHERD